MEKRLILAAILSLLVIILYQFLLTRITPPSPTPKKVENEEAKREVTPTIKRPSLPPIKVEKKEGETEIIVYSPFYKARISSLGGGLKGWQLNKYRQTLDKDSENIEMVTTAKRGLYPYQVFDKNGKPVIFSIPSQEITLTEGMEKELSFYGITSDGLELAERLIFSGDTYNINIEVMVKNPTNNNVETNIALNLFKSIKGMKSSRYSHIGPVSYVNDGVVAEKLDKITSKDYQGVLWTGLEDKYFLFALIPSEKTGVHLGKFDDVIFTRLQYPLSLPPGGSQRIKLKAYAGPKEVDIIEGYGVHLEDTVNFGIFSILAKPLLAIMKFFYRFVKNYGISIIILTVIIKIIFYPLSLKSLRSMKDMQKIQPQMAVIKEKYKNDKERMNRELMELYKRSKVNPIGGCLPMILQIPVFIALYNVLLLSIELRHAPFLLWIKDLSDKDPYYITPILMGASMFVQQRMSPTAMDPQQAKMMLFMPVVFTFLFLNFPAGLVIYWLVNNILSIVQQYYIQKKV